MTHLMYSYAIFIVSIYQLKPIKRVATFNLSTYISFSFPKHPPTGSVESIISSPYVLQKYPKHPPTGSEESIITSPYVSQKYPKYPQTGNAESTISSPYVRCASHSIFYGLYSFTVMYTD